jgi:hypothetical protein
MNLPSFFIADLPAEAELSARMIADACLTLKRNRTQYLAGRSTQSVIELLSHIGNCWLKPEFPLRKVAIEEASARTPFSAESMRKGLDHFFGQLTPANFQALLEQDLGVPHKLERMCCGPGEEQTGRASIVSAPELLAHITAGNVPVSAMAQMVLGVLVRSAQFVKCATGAAFLPRLLAHSLYDADRKLGACLEIAEWKGGHAALEQALFDAADCITASGSDETLASIRKNVPPGKKFIGYGHRVSFAYIASEALAGATAVKMVERACEDVSAWNQLGCLSPHVIYVQDGGLLSPEKFAELLADALALREGSDPRGQVPSHVSAEIGSRRQIYELRATQTGGTRIWSSKDSTAWTVVYESEARFQLSCLNRFIYVKRVKDLQEVLHGADSLRGKVSTVGLGSVEHETEALATELARWGVPRVCPLGQMQKPPLGWRHDGRPALGQVVTWTDWEME